MNNNNNNMHMCFFLHRDHQEHPHPLVVLRVLVFPYFDYFVDRSATQSKLNYFTLNQQVFKEFCCSLLNKRQFSFEEIERRRAWGPISCCLCLSRARPPKPQALLFVLQKCERLFVIRRAGTNKACVCKHASENELSTVRGKTPIEKSFKLNFSFVQIIWQNIFYIKYIYMQIFLQKII